MFVMYDMGFVIFDVQLFYEQCSMDGSVKLVYDFLIQFVLFLVIDDQFVLFDRYLCICIYLYCSGFMVMEFFDVNCCVLCQC